MSTDLHDRLNRLEAELGRQRRSLRRWRRLSLGSVLCLGALATMGQAPSTKRGEAARQACSMLRPCHSV